VVLRGSQIVSVVGATGLVGSEIVRLLLLRGFPLSGLILFASGNNPERKVCLAGREVRVRPFALDALRGTDICFLAAGGDFSRHNAEAIAGLGVTVIDNSSAFRMDSRVPLVVPEINADDLAEHSGLIANPNCSTIQMVLALAPLHREWRLRRVIVSTYQAVTGAGLMAAGELARQSDAVLRGKKVSGKVFPHPIAFNVLPHIDKFDSQGWTREEKKMRDETKKIMGDSSIEVIATAVRVPVFRGHSEAVHAEFMKSVDLERARLVLSRTPGIEIVDDPAESTYPMPIDCAGMDITLVGRLRRDPTSDRALCMWIVSDNLRKGAALNAVQIAERLV
jgi:aspartate-semialdehyde dehydrogenase